jgi:hypothetical protein
MPVFLHERKTRMVSEATNKVSYVGKGHGTLSSISIN